jgi:hypothetical protein
VRIGLPEASAARPAEYHQRMGRSRDAILACAIAACAACGGHRGRGQDAPPAPPPEPARREPFVVAQTEVVHAIARDASHLYWADSTGIRRRPLGGSDAGKAELVHDATADWGQVVAMVVHDGRIYASDGADVAAVPIGGGDAIELATGLDVVALAVADDGAYLALTDRIVRVPLGGGAPVELAGGQTRIGDLVVAGDHVYWTDYADDPTAIAGYGYGYGYYGAPDPGEKGSVRRTARRRGAVDEIASAQNGPFGLAVIGDRVWWCTDRGPGLVSAPVGGGELRVEQAGRFDRLAVDDRGVVVRNVNGFVIERGHGDGARVELRLIGDAAWMASTRAAVLDDEWVYAITHRLWETPTAIVALPRQREPIEVIATTTSPVLRTSAHDGDVYWVEVERDRGTFAIHRADASGGARRELARDDGYITELAVGGGHVYVALDQSSIRRVPITGGTLHHFARAEQSSVTGLTVHRNHVFWLDGSILVAKQRRRGQRRLVVAQGDGYSYGEVGIDLVFDDDYVYLTNFGGAAGVFRISERGRVDMVWDGSHTYPGKDLVRIGDELFFAGSGSTVIWRLRPGETAEPLHRTGISTQYGSYVYDLIAGGDYLYVASTQGNEQMELARVDPSTGETQIVARWVQYSYEGSSLSADGHGVYAALDALNMIVRIPHDAPPAPDTGGHALTAP